MRLLPNSIEITSCSASLRISSCCFQPFSLGAFVCLFAYSANFSSSAGASMSAPGLLLVR